MNNKLKNRRQKMNTILCYINNVPVTSRHCKLFDMYEKYIHGNSIEADFSRYQEHVKDYCITFIDVIDEAKTVYEKIMG